MHPVHVRFLIDFGGPNANLRRRVIPASVYLGVANTQPVHDQGVFSSPSFFIGNELWFSEDRLRDVGDAILAGAAR